MNRRAVVVGIATATTLPGCIQSIPDYSDDVPNETTMDETIEPDQRIDEPPHEIETPDANDPEEWNEEYLGENMATEPSLAFERIESVRLADTTLNSGDEAYNVRVLRDSNERDSVLDTEAVDEDTRQRLEAVDFDESVLVVVESGYGSSSVTHRWARVEETPDAIHLHGYYTDPFEQFDDIAMWHSVLEVERPDDGVEFARVSLTVDPDRRVHFNSTEGVVTLEN